jgi:AcrR family transcriptional regulator
MTTSIRLRNAELRRKRAESVLDSARELLLKLGYKRVTMEDVAEHAGVGKGTVYLHWSTREDMYFDVVLREYMRAMDGFLNDMRRDGREVLLHRIVRAKYLAAMRSPLLRALFGGDAELIGKLAQGDRKGQIAKLDVVSKDYLRLLMAHHVIRRGISAEDLFYGVGAVTIGFLFADAALGDRSQEATDVEHRAALLEAALERSFEQEPPAGALESLAPQVITMMSRSMDVLRSSLRERKEGEQ